ncbi:hypothetical protein JCM5353_008277 [Sporobolomyces roseus]
MSNFRDTEQHRAKVIETSSLVFVGATFDKHFLDFYALVAASFGLRSIIIRRMDHELDLTQLSRLQSEFKPSVSKRVFPVTADQSSFGVDLSRLHLTDCSIRSSCPYTLPKLDELGLRDVYPPSSYGILTPLALPSLRILSAGHSEADGGEVAGLLERFSHQLEVIWIDLFTLASLSQATFERINRKTLFDEYFDFTHTLPPVHSFRLWGIPGNDFGMSDLIRLGNMVQIASTPLPSVLYLAGCRYPANDLNSKLSREYFTSLCKKRNIEVVYESAPEWTVDGGRPKEFFRRMRGGKENEKARDKAQRKLGGKAKN